MKKPSAAEKRSASRPKRVELKREEVLKRMRTISEWREKTLAEFKRRYPGAFKNTASLNDFLLFVRKDSREVDPP